MMRNTADAKRLAEMIKNIRIAMMITVDAEGRLRARPMAAQKVEFDGELWFFTSRKCAKTEEIQHDANVNICFVKPETNRYVSVSGRARLVHDDARMQELWDASFLEFFPGGLADPDLVLIGIVVDSAEYWDAPGDRVAPPRQRSVSFNRGVITSRATAEVSTPPAYRHETLH
jgi:general stress protein 26